MNRLGRIERLERAVAELRPDPLIVRRAFADFRKTGELPEDAAIGRAVISWADTGIDSTKYGDDSDSRAFLLRAYVDSARAGDKLMNELREEAMFAIEPIRSVARGILKILADQGHDPSQPLFQQGSIPVPDMVWPSVAMSLIKFPFGLVHQVHHERLTSVVGRILGRQAVDPSNAEAWNAWFERLNVATNVFEETGELPADPLLRDLVVAGLELDVLFRASCGHDDLELRAALAACDDSNGGLLPAAVSIVQDLVAARARRGVPTPGVPEG